MQSPGTLFAATLIERSIRKTEFARRVKRTYQTVYGWTKDQHFEEPQQELAALELGLPADAFKAKPDVLERRKTQANAVLDSFLRTAKLSATDIATLNSIRFYDPTKGPTVQFYKAVTRALAKHLK